MMPFGADQRASSVVALVEALTEATRQGRADWTPTSRPDKYLFSDSTGSVTIASNQLGSYELEFELLDPNGHVLEIWRGGALGHRGGTHPGLAHAMTQLHQEVAARGQRTDRVIEDMLAKLRSGRAG